MIRLAAFAMTLPGMAMAFGDMDCVTMEFCRADACGAEVLPMTLRFDWPNHAVALSFMIADDTLTMQPQTEGDTALSFATDTSRLTLDYAGDDILATYIRSADDLMVTAQCEPLRAA